MTNIENEIEVLIRELAAKLVEVTVADMRERAFAAVAAVVGGGEADTTTVPVAAGRTAKKTFKLSPKGLAARKVQGQYLGMLRGLSAGNRLRAKKVAREQGVAAAVKFGSTLR